MNTHHTKPMRLTLPLHMRARHWFVDTWRSTEWFEPLVVGCVLFIVLAVLLTGTLLVVDLP